MYIWENFHQKPFLKFISNLINFPASKRNERHKNTGIIFKTAPPWILNKYILKWIEKKDKK